MNETWTWKARIENLHKSFKWNQFTINGIWNLSPKRNDQPITLTRNNTVKSTRGWINSFFNFIEKVFNKSTETAPPSDSKTKVRHTSISIQSMSYDVPCECDPISCKKMHLNPSKVFYNKYRMPIVKRSNNRTDDVLENKQLNNKQDYIIDPDR